MAIGSSLVASRVFTCVGFSLQIIKAKVLEVGDKLLIYIQRAGVGGGGLGVDLSPWGAGGGDSCAVSLRSSRQQAAATAICAAAWTPPVGHQWKVHHQPDHQGLPPQSANYKRFYLPFLFSSASLFSSQQPLHCSLLSPQIIKDRVFSHVSRNKYMWNSLPGGLLVLPEYSTHLAHFPFYYLGLGKGLPQKCTARFISNTWFLKGLF